MLKRRATTNVAREKETASRDVEVVVKPLMIYWRKCFLQPQ
jgi:hypothetical protein